MERILSASAALAQRDQLVELGYTVISGLLQDPLLDELRAWAADIFERMPIDPKFRYQGSDIHVWTPRRWSETDHGRNDRSLADPIVERLIDHPPQVQVCAELGLENLRADDVAILLSKPAYGPPLYWHQDFTNWNHPEAAAPWPTRIFLSYYMSDTHRDDAIDVPLEAGDLIFADARLIHGAWPNQTDQRRTLVLAWHQVFNFPEPPSWWRGPIPDVVNKCPPDLEVAHTRTPSNLLE